MTEQEIQEIKDAGVDLTTVPNFFLRMAAESVVTIKTITESYERELIKAMDKCMCLKSEKARLKEDAEAVLAATAELEESALIISSCLERMSFVKSEDDDD